MSFKRILMSIYDKVIYWKWGIYDFFTSQEIDMSIGDILLGMSFDSKMQNLTISRLLDIENHYNSDDDSFYYLNAFSSVNPLFDRDLANRLFLKLLDSVDQNGYKQEYAPIIDVDGRLWNGTHRIAVCLYHKIETVRMKSLKRPSSMNGSFNLQATNLTEDDYKKIRVRYDEIIKEFADKGITFCCVGETIDKINGVLTKAFSSDCIPINSKEINIKGTNKRAMVQFILKYPHYVRLKGSLHVKELIDFQKENSNIKIATNCQLGQRLFREFEITK